MIEADRLTKRFRTRKKRRTVEVLAVDGVSFTCRPGEVFGLLGANGAGKTTTLRMLSTILTPTSGTARVGGYDVVEDPVEVRRRVGFLSTFTALYARLTAREMVEYFGRLAGLAERDLRDRVDELVQVLEMGGFEGQRCGTLSTGQKQKVSVARTLVHDPPVMVFDEPTSGLDVMTQRIIHGFVRRCRDDGKTVILSTHVMSEAARLCDRIAIIHGGRIVADDTLDGLRSRYGIDDLEDLFIHLVTAGEEGAA